METAMDGNDPVKVRPGGVVSVCEKRGAEEDGESEEVLEGRSAKRANSGSREMSKVSEIVLVLSAMAGLRGGMSPTEAELDLMAEARAKLADICQDSAPKELVARDAIGNVIEDLGLNWKVKDKRLGFRGNRISIKERVLLAKRKMEDSKKFAAASAVYASQALQPSIGSLVGSHGQSHMIHMFTSDKHSNQSLPSGGLPAIASLGHVPAANSASLTRLPPTEVQASIGLTSHNLGRDSSTLASHKVDRTQLKSEGGPSGSSNASQLQANVSTNHLLVNAPTWSIQPHSASSVKSASEMKVPNHNLAKVEGTADLGMPQAASLAVRDQASQPFVNQTGPPSLPSIHQPMQGVKYVQPPTFFNNHQEIAKNVQKLLPPKFPKHPTWTPTSREYMNKALPCQGCKLTVNEVETVVICDACEKGFHLKCLQAINQKGIPRGEWHCISCTALNNGKPFPPKYGRVMRSITPTKGPSNLTGGQSSSEKKVVIEYGKVNQENVAANGSSGTENPLGSGARGSKTLDSNTPTVRQMPQNIVTSSGKDVDQVISVGTFPNSPTKPLGTVSGLSAVSLLTEQSIQQTMITESLTRDEKTVSELKHQPSTTSDEICNKNECSKASNNSQCVIQKEESKCVGV